MITFIRLLPVLENRRRRFSYHLNFTIFYMELEEEFFRKGLEKEEFFSTDQGGGAAG